VPALIIIFYLCPTISNFVNIYDKILNKKFIKKAKETIKNSNTRIIAITGSNGKTSVKNILFDFLSLNYKVLKTPSSYNTPLGIAKFINENFNSYYDFIILEYGARRKGDIRKLCKLYGANCGILTTISPQHLETFKTITNIKNTKNELPKFLHNKICIFNLENKICNELYLKKTGLKEAVSLSSNTNVFADNIKIKNGKTLFTLHSNNNQFNCQTNLLGKHNVLNILLAFSLAKNLNIETDKIVEAIKNLKPTPHRLELIRTHINILDDTYNCSISSATEALEVLKEFDGKKMVATPGIIECGKMKSEINKSLGEKLYFCDYIIIIGELNKNAILTGLKNKNFDINKIIICKTIEEAKSYFKLLKTNDTLLLLNDLPDDYK